MCLPTQYASAVLKIVISSIDATAGRATVVIVRTSGPLTSVPCDGASPVAGIAAMPSRELNGNAATGASSGSRASSIGRVELASLTP